MEDQGAQPPQPILGQQATWAQGKNEVREGWGRMRKVSLGVGRGGGYCVGKPGVVITERFQVCTVNSK